MSLQRRLTLFFILIVMLPLVATGFAVRAVLLGEAEQRASLSLQSVLSATVLSYNGHAEGLDDVVISTVGSREPVTFARLLARGSGALLRGALQARLAEERERLDFLVALDARGRRIASVSTPPRFSGGFGRPSFADIVRVARRASRAGVELKDGPGFIATSGIPLIDARGDVVGSVVGGFWLDREVLAESDDEAVDAALVSGDRPTAFTSKPAGRFAGDVAQDPEAVEVPGADTTRAERLLGDAAVVAWTPGAHIELLSREIFLIMLALLVLALILTAFLAHWLAQLIAEPLAELSAGAEAIANKRFDHKIPVRSSDEVGQVAVAFNKMADELKAMVTQLSSSRDQMQRAVQRVGETLRSTHDMRQIRESIVDTAADAVEADAVVFWAFTPTREELYPAIGRNVDVEEFHRVRVGEGVVGHVAERGTTILRPARTGTPAPARIEPSFPTQIAVPLYSRDRISAVIALYRKEKSKPFTFDDLDNVVFLAEQGGVAIENVALHEEAQRLSITDGLTGVWNRRYFQMQFRQALATSLRFNRSFSLLMLDLDHFKQINDTHGHQRGDAILIEFAQRVSRTLREVDMFARYGGEEFIVLLSETDAYGASRTAKKILTAMSSEPFGGVDEEPIRLTVSIGVACYPEHGDSYRALVEAADQALYAAKQGGRNRVVAAAQPSSDGAAAAPVGQEISARSARLR